MAGRCVDRTRRSWGRVPVLLQQGYLGQWLADIHITLPEIPHRHAGFHKALLAHDNTEVDAHGSIAMQQIEHVPGHAQIVGFVEACLAPQRISHSPPGYERIHAIGDIEVVVRHAHQGLRLDIILAEPVAPVSC